MSEKVGGGAGNMFGALLWADSVVLDSGGGPDA